MSAEIDGERREQLLAAFLAWYRETEARAATHPAGGWIRPPRDLRERVAQLVREIAPEKLPCPCTSCVNMRAGAQVRP